MVDRVWFGILVLGGFYGVGILCFGFYKGNVGLG